MKSLAFLATSALIAATPVSIGLIGNASFSEDVPVKVPSTATLLDNEGNAVSTTRVVAAKGGDDHAKPRLTKRRIVERADDHGQKGRADDRARGEDHGRHGEAEPGDDHGGRRATSVRDDNGGRRSTTTSDDHGGSRPHHTRRSDDGGSTSGG